MTPTIPSPMGASSFSNNLSKGLAPLTQLFWQKLTPPINGKFMCNILFAFWISYAMLYTAIRCESRRLLSISLMKYGKVFGQNLWQSSCQEMVPNFVLINALKLLDNFSDKVAPQSSLFLLRRFEMHIPILNSANSTKTLLRLERIRTFEFPIKSTSGTLFWLE